MTPPDPEQTPDQSPTSPSSAGTIATGKTQAANLCAVGVGICFFLPWLRILFGQLSGYDFQQLGGGTRLLWMMPVLSVLTLCAGLSGNSQKIVGQLAGTSPFVIFVYGLYTFGGDMLQAMQLGGWLALVAGGVLFVLVRR